jgi:pyrroloquinoline quinone (PQQ) biosynthesis protein C
MGADPVVNADTLYGAAGQRRIVDHPWFKAQFRTGRASKRQARDMATQLIPYYDNLIELYGPMYMNSADYTIRRLFVDKMLTPIKLGNGTALRIGEGAHAELARELARALGQSAKAARAAVPSPALEDRFGEMIVTMERPVYWVTLGACAAVESQMKGLNRALAKAFRTHYGVPERALGLFKAPALFAPSDVDHALQHCRDSFDGLRLVYYTERLRDEWYSCWDSLFASTQGTRVA